MKVQTLRPKKIASSAPSIPVRPAVQIDEIAPVELKQWLDSGRKVQIIDVREPHEYAQGHLANAKLIPLTVVVDRSSEIDPAQAAVVMCKGGVRSAKAISALKQNRYSGQLINLKGGILAWSQETNSPLSNE